MSLNLEFGARDAIKKILSNDNMLIAKLKSKCLLFVEILLSKLQASCPLESCFLRTFSTSYGSNAVDKMRRQVRADDCEIFVGSSSKQDF